MQKKIKFIFNVLYYTDTTISIIVRTNESFLAEYRALAENIVFNFNLKYKVAIEQNPQISSASFFKSTAKDFCEQLATLAEELLHKSVTQGSEPDLGLTIGFEKISHECTEAYAGALFSK